MNDRQKKERYSGVRDRESVRYWIGIGRHPMPTILKRSTASIKRTRCWNTRSPASEPAVVATYRTNEFVAPAWRAQWVERMNT